MSARTRKSDAIRASTELVEIRAMCPAVLRAASGPRKFEVVVLASGFGANSEQGRQWFVPDTDEGLGSAVKVFGGAKVHWARGTSAQYDHRSDDSPLARWLDDGHEVGYLSDVRRVEGSLVAMLNVADDVPAEVLEVIAARRVGLSIEAAADRRPAIRDGKAVVELINFRHGAEQASVAVVSHPALAGEILRVAASRRSPTMNLVQALAILASVTASAAEKLTAARFVAADATATPEQLADAGRILASAPPPHPAPTATLTAEAEARIKAAQEKLDATLLETDILTAHNVALGLVQAAKLPPKSHVAVMASIDAEIRASAEARKDPTAFTTKAIDAKRAELAEVDVRVLGAGTVQVGAGAPDKMALCLERMILGNAPKYAKDRFAKLFASAGGKPLEDREQAAGIGYSDRAWSFRNTFREFTGGDITELWTPGSNPRKDRLRASVNLAQWGDVFENVLNIAGLAMQENPEFSDWRKIVTIVPFSGTLKQERTVVGGYANLPTVAEGANYTAATSPADQGHGYTPTKAGYTEDWTRESMMNDRIGALAGILMKMAVAADRTKYEFVFDKLTIAGQPTMDYDSTALYHANHGGNLLTTALSTGLPAARLVMLKQAQLTNSKRMGLMPRFLIVPLDLQETAENLLKPTSEEPGGLTTEREFLRRMNLVIIPVRHWTNTTDWVLAADPNNGLVPTFEMGFESGREQADIFVQDMANVGSVFERDAVTVAVKQPYFGGSPLRHEGFVGNDVA